MAHSHHMHREHQVSHRRVHAILKGEPTGAMEHHKRPAFSKVTSKTAAEHHGAKVSGDAAPKKYARGGKVKGHKSGHQTNIIVVPHHQAAPPMAGPAGPPPPGAGLPPGPMGGPPGGPPGMPPGAPPPGMPMRARGGRANHIAGEATKGNISKWSERASKNSYFRGGAATGVGREEKAHKQKGKK
jgi:hypothetical protein